MKEFFGVEPKHVDEINQVYSPSKTALKVAVKNKTDYDNTSYDNAYKGNDLKILIIGTEEDRLTMENGKIFLTGNHPVELFVPMLHWQKAGFSFDFATPSGKEMKLEQWAMPIDDTAVMKLYSENKNKIENPLNLNDLVKTLDKNSNYAAIFIPGGHGAVLGLPFNSDVKKVLHWAQNENKYIISICHGPAALLAANNDEDENNFIFKEYEIASFPDSMDKLMPGMGYLPGQMPWFFGKELEKLGVTIINNLATGNVHQDRKLITGDSPLAANKLGKLSTTLLLEEVNN